MLKFRISLANEPGETYEVDGFEAVLGRAPTCDVVVAQKHITVSGRHARVMSGIVVLDLGSANGTFVSARNIADGNKVSKGQVAGAEVAPNGEFTIGNSVFVQVESDLRGTVAAGGAAPAEGDDQRLIELDRALSEERERNAELSRKMQEALDQAGVIADDAILTHPLVQQIIDEREDLRKRLDSSTAEVKSLRADEGTGVSAANHQNNAESARQRSEELQAEATRLQRQVDELREENRRLAAGGGDSDDSPTNVFGADDGAALHAEIEQLRGKVAQLTAAAAAAPAAQPTGSPSEVFKKLNEEIQRLSGELSEAKAEISRLGTAGGAAAAGTPAPTAKPATHTATTNPVMVGGGLAILKKIADAGVDAVPQDLERPVDQFFYSEMFRFLRTSERVLTDVVCKALELIGGKTMMPGHEQTLGPLVAAVIDNPTEYGPKRELVGYVKELERWLLIGTQIFPEAANKYAVELRDGLSESALTAGNPIPRMSMLSGGKESELWRRAQALLSDQSGETIRDRINSLARDLADRMQHGR